jgi:hypothetical protein
MTNSREKEEQERRARKRQELIINLQMLSQMAILMLTVTIQMHFISYHRRSLTLKRINTFVEQNERKEFLEKYD